MIAFDLDGTLLNDQKQITSRSLSALDAAAQAGTKVVVASGRVLEAIPAPLLELPYIRYYILLNGAQIYDKKLGVVCYSADLSREDASDIIDELDKLDLICTCSLDGRYCMDAADYDVLETRKLDPQALHILLHTRHRIEHLKSAIISGRNQVQTIMAVLEAGGDRLDLMRHLKSCFPTLNITSSHFNNVEIGACGADKGSAVRFLAGQLQISASQIMTIGDSYNDISMLQYAGMGVVVDNAPDEIKKYASAIAPSNNADGVAWAVEQAIR